MASGDDGRKRTLITIASRLFRKTDFTEDLAKITVPTLIMHGDDDQVVPIADSALLTAKLIQKRNAYGIQGLPAWDVHHACGSDQWRSAQLCAGVITDAGSYENQSKAGNKIHS